MSAAEAVLRFAIAAAGIALVFAETRRNRPASWLAAGGDVLICAGFGWAAAVQAWLPLAVLEGAVSALGLGVGVYVVAVRRRVR